MVKKDGIQKGAGHAWSALGNPVVLYIYIYIYMCVLCSSDYYQVPTSYA
jgi:hypothetical protein